MPALRFDLVVVGSGSGLDVANWAVGAGWRVALVEKGPLGGTCLNRGCIPSKLLLHSAEVAMTLRRAPLFGIHPKGFDVDFPALMKRVRDSVDGDAARIEHALRHRENPRLFQGEARFVGPRALQVGDDVLEGERVLLATGARPRIPDVPGLPETPFLTSTEALRAPALPASMIVLGGGYVGCELAHFFGSLGTRVSIVQRRDTLVPGEDEEIARALTAAYRRRFDVRTRSEPVAVRREGEGVAMDVRGPDGGVETLRAQTLLVAAGVTPNSDRLALERTRIRTDLRGFLRVDPFLETDEPGVFALGDAVGRFLFKHNANHEASYAWHNMRQPPGGRIAVDYHAMPHAIFSWPQVAGVGATEQDLRASGVQHRVARWRHRDTAMGHALEDEDGFVKILVDPHEGHVLGCHVLGHEAAILLHEVLPVMKANGTLEDIARTVHVHPALSEVVHRAATSL